MEIGNLKIEVPLILAPMAGYSDSALRSLAREFGAGLTYTEMINAAALARGVKLSFHMLESRPSERPLAAHIYGTDPSAMAAAAAIAADTGRYDAIDINCGCPVRKIVAKGAGVALMAHPDRIRQIVAACKDAVDLPVMIKTRLGLSPTAFNLPDVARTAVDGGADAIAVHARYAEQRHGGSADWSKLTEMKSLLDVPVIGNGGIREPEDAVRMMRQTGVDAVMIGRRAIGSPWFFRDLLDAMEGRPVRPFRAASLRRVIREHLQRLIALKRKEQQIRRRSLKCPERAALMLFRGHLVKYLAGYRGVKALLRNMDRFDTADHFMDAVNQLLDRGMEYEPSRVEPVAR